MADALTRKKGQRAGHKGSATKIIGRIDDTMNDFQWKLEVIKILDAKVLKLIKEAALADEIERADSYKEGIYQVLT